VGLGTGFPALKEGIMIQEKMKKMSPWSLLTMALSGAAILVRGIRTENKQKKERRI